MSVRVMACWAAVLAAGGCHWLLPIGKPAADTRPADRQERSVVEAWPDAPRNDLRSHDGPRADRIRDLAKPDLRKDLPRDRAGDVRKPDTRQPDASASCSAVSCPGGCCSGSMCLPGNTDTACGKAGATCAGCAAGQMCVNQVCSACIPSCVDKCAGADDGCGGPCLTNDCPGCCSSQSACALGTADGACGKAGAFCMNCKLRYGLQSTCKNSSCTP